MQYPELLRSRREAQMAESYCLVACRLVGEKESTGPAHTKPDPFLCSSLAPGIVGKSEWDIAPIGEQPYVAPAMTNTSQMLDLFDENTQTAVNSLRGVPDSVMYEPWSLKMGGQTLFTMNKGDCIRKWVFSHSAHHRGILSAYLRMAGLQFPSIYEE